MAIPRGIEPRSPERQSGIIAFIPWHHMLAFLTRVGKHSARILFPSTPASNSGLLTVANFYWPQFACLIRLKEDSTLTSTVSPHWSLQRRFPYYRLNIKIHILQRCGSFPRLRSKRLACLLVCPEDIHDYLFNGSVYNRSVPKVLLNSLHPN